MSERCPIGLPIEETVAYAEGALSPAEQARIAAHLAECGVCRRRLAAFAETDRLLREGSPPLDDPAGRAALLARVAREARQGGHGQ